MNFKEIQDLIKLVNKMDLAEVKIEQGDFRISIRTTQYTKARSTQEGVPQIVSIPQVSTQEQVTPSAPSVTAESSGEQDDQTNLIEVRSPIVGTFYRSSSPDKPPFAKVGDVISVGDVVCIVEAMKLFNEIESEVSGKVVKVMVEDASPVEYDQVLFLVDPKG
jgi:acetyl-CoA carboxylase biotin carboxyl carrier protein